MIDAIDDEAAARTGFSMGYHNDCNDRCHWTRLEHFLARYLMRPQLVQSSTKEGHYSRYLPNAALTAFGTFA
jgi:hypothetical protein